MKMRAPGSQLTAQTLWMLSLPNPKLGVCKFAPVLGCWWERAALPAERFGALLWTQRLLSLVPALQGVTGTEVDCPVRGWLGCCQRGGHLVQGGSASSWAGAGTGQALLLPLGCHTLAGDCSRAASRCHHQTQREVGIRLLPWESSSPPRPLSALCAVLGCGIRAAAKTPPHPAAPEPGKSSTHWTRSWSRRERASRQPAPPTEPRQPSDPT